MAPFDKIAFKEKMEAATPVELHDLLKADLKNYKGLERHLNSFLDTMGTYNPYDAIYNIHVDEIEFNLTKKNKAKLKVIDSASGHKLYDSRVIISSLINGRIFKSGGQLIGNILDNFQSETGKKIMDELKNASGVKYVEKKKEEKKIDVNTNYAKSVKEIFLDRKKLPTVQLAHEREKVQHLLDLNDVLLQYHLQADSLLGEQINLTDDPDAITALATDPSGTTINWVKRKAKQEFVPELFVKYAYALSDNDLWLSDEQTELMWTSIKMYESSTREININEILGGYFEDIKYVATLNEDHPVIKKAGVPTVSKIVDILNKGGQGTLMDVQRFLNTNIGEVRTALNEWYMNESGKFSKEDYDSTIGTFSEMFDSEKYFLDNKDLELFLTKKDQANLKQMLRTDKTFSPRDVNLYQSRHHELFKERINGVVVAGRKKKAFEEMPKKNITDSVSRKQVKDDFKFLRKISYMPNETFSITTNDDEVIDISDFIQRANSYTYKMPTEISNLVRNLLDLVPFGIYDTKLVEKLEKLEFDDTKNFKEHLLSLKSKKKTQEMYDIIRKVYTHPLLLTAHSINTKSVFMEPTVYDSLQHFKDLEQVLCENFAEIGKKLTVYDYDELDVEKTTKSKNDFATIFEKFHNLGTYVVRVNLEPSGPVFSSDSKFTIAKKYEQWNKTPENNIYFVTVDNYDNFKNEMNSIVLPPKGLASKAEFLASFSGQRLMNFSGKADTNNYFRATQMKQENVYTTKDSIQIIENLYASCKEKYNLSIIPVVISGDKDVLLSDKTELSDKFKASIKNTSFKDAGKLKDVVKGFQYVRNEGWVSRYNKSKGDIGLDSKDIMQYNAKNDRNLILEVKKV